MWKGSEKQLFTMQKTVSAFFGGARTLEELRLRTPDYFKCCASTRRQSKLTLSQRGFSCIELVGMAGIRSASSSGKKVRGKGFPRVNDRDSHRQGDGALKRAMTLQALGSAVPFVIIVAAACPDG